jgi:hypothetical protein
MSIGSLNLIQPIDLETGNAQLSVANAALHDVARRGFQFPGVPQQGYQGVLPPYIINLNDEQLGDLLQNIATWCSWAQAELAKARQARNEAEAKMEFTKSRVRLAIKASSEGRKPSNPEMDDVVKCDPRYIDAQRNYLYCEAVYDYTKNLVEAGQRDWDTASRRITQRGQEIERNRRGENVGQTPQVPVLATAFRRPG